MATSPSTLEPLDSEQPEPTPASKPKKDHRVLIVAGIAVGALLVAVIVAAARSSYEPATTPDALRLPSSFDRPIFIGDEQVFSPDGEAAARAAAPVEEPAQPAADDPVVAAPAVDETSDDSADDAEAPPASDAVEDDTADAARASVDRRPVGPLTTVEAAADGVFYKNDFSAESDMGRIFKGVHDGAGDFASFNPSQHFNGDHNEECAGPTTSRVIDTGVTDDGKPAASIEDSINRTFWYCAPGGDPAKGHFMTGIFTENYVTLAFSPSVDGGATPAIFPEAANKICWSQNITDLGHRKWIQLLVVSEDRILQDADVSAYINPGFTEQGGPTATPLAGDDFMYVNVQNSLQTYVGQNKMTEDFDGYGDVTDKATRYQICVTDNGDDTVTVTQALPDGSVESRTAGGRFPAGPRAFALQDETYNPLKSCYAEGDCPQIPDPFTWHWDDIQISSV